MSFLTRWSPGARILLFFCASYAVLALLWFIFVFHKTSAPAPSPPRASATVQELQVDMMILRGKLHRLAARPTPKPAPVLCDDGAMILRRKMKWLAENRTAVCDADSSVAAGPYSDHIVAVIEYSLSHNARRTATFASFLLHHDPRWKMIKKAILSLGSERLLPVQPREGCAPVDVAPAAGREQAVGALLAALTLGLPRHEMVAYATKKVSHLGVHDMQDVLDAVLLYREQQANDIMEKTLVRRVLGRMFVKKDRRTSHV